jgi:cyclophilin family peptidyl-prolyl cis-trans isomerase
MGIRSFALLSILSAFCLFTFVGCGGSESPPAASIEDKGKEGDSSSNPGDDGAGTSNSDGEYKVPDLDDSSDSFTGFVSTPPPNPSPRVIVTTNVGKFTITLNREKAPITVQNFLDNYVEPGFYDGTVLHYVDKGKVIAGGGFTADGKAKEVRGQVFNEATNGLKNVRGTIALARELDYRNSGTSQFLLNVSDNPMFDHTSEETDAEYGYCVFGEVTEGMDVVEKIGNTATKDTELFVGYPVEPIVIQSIEQID